MRVRGLGGRRPWKGRRDFLTVGRNPRSDALGLMHEC
jgi:hypothetical protein